ncbi:MAG: hypothetical protein ACOYJ1_11530 [Peptococcales bacterium]
MTEEFIQGVFARIATYFTDLGFRVKVDPKKYKIWLIYSRKQISEKHSFTENLTNIFNARKNYRVSSEIDGTIKDIFSKIREKARRNRSIKYRLILNVPNKKTLLLEDLIEIIGKLEEAGFRITLDEFSLSKVDILEKVQANDAEIYFENLEVNINISW